MKGKGLATPVYPDFDEPGLDDVAGFPVTVRSTIGWVELGDGPDNPYAAAFRLIAQHGERGTFEFPLRDGQMCTVEVSWPDEVQR